MGMFLKMKKLSTTQEEEHEEVIEDVPSLRFGDVCLKYCKESHSSDCSECY